MPTLYLKDPRRVGGWHNSAGSSSDGQVMWVVRLSSNSKVKENVFLINNKVFFFLKHVCETINDKQTKKEKKEYREWKSDDEVRLIWH